MAFHPAILLTGGTPLEDPLGKLDSIRIPGALPANIEDQLARLRGRIRSAYIDQFWLRVKAVLDACKKWEVRVLLFPEYSIPWELLPRIAADAGDLVVIAGTHMVDRAAMKAKAHESLGAAPEMAPQLGNAVAPVLHGGRLIGLQPKLQKSKFEDDKLTSGRQWSSVVLPSTLPGPMGVLICIDFLSREAGPHRHLVAEKLAGCRFLAVPSLTPASSTVEFSARAWEEARRYGRPVLYANEADQGGTSIFVDEGGEPDLRDFPKRAGYLEKGDEGVVVADVDLGFERTGPSTPYDYQPPMRPFACATLVGAWHPASVRYAVWLDKLETVLGEDVEIDTAVEAVENEREALLLAGALPGCSARDGRLRRLLRELPHVTSAEEILRFTREVRLPGGALPPELLRAALAGGAAEALFDIYNDARVPEVAHAEKAMRDAARPVLSPPVGAWSGDAARAAREVMKAVRGPEPPQPTGLRSGAVAALEPDTGEAATSLETSQDQLGIAPTDAKTLLEWVRASRLAARPAIPAPDGQEAQKLLDWLADPRDPLPFRVRAGRLADLLWFAESTLETEQEWKDRAFVVFTDPGMRVLADRPAPLLLIACFRVRREDLGNPVRSGHKVLVWLDPTSSAFDEIVLEPNRALSGSSGQIAPPAVPADHWSKRDLGRQLIGPLFAGTWREDNQADRLVLERISGKPYAELEAILKDATLEGDAPVRFSGSTWHFPARKEVWSLLQGRFTPTELERFENAAIEALSVPDPAWDLPADQRLAARLIVKTPVISSECQAGVVEGLAMLARDDRADGGQRAAVSTVRGTLKKADRDWKRWATLSGVLPDLAEIDPDGFLQSLENDIQRDEPEALKLFGHDRGIFSTAPHVGLLRALECLAWSPRYLSRAALMLARLARLDPGGTYGNRPAASLISVFRLWFPQTSATLEQRERVLDQLQDREPDVSFRLLVSMLPKDHDTAMPSGSPRWRSWKPEGDPEVSGTDYWESAVLICRRAVVLCKSQPERWMMLIPELHAIPPAERSEALASLRGLIPDVEPSLRGELWNAIRDLVNKHRAFRSAEWALSQDAINEIAELLPLVEPQDRVAASVWLFSNDPEIGIEGDWESRASSLEQRRREALELTLSDQGLDGVLKLAVKAEAPWFAGRTLGALPLRPEQEELLLVQEFGDERTTPELFGRGFIAGRIETFGQEWVARQRELNRKRWSPAQLATLYLMMRSCPDTWDQVQHESAQVQESYWKALPPFGFGYQTDHIRATTEYLRFGNPVAAAHLLGLYARTGSAEEDELVVAAIEAAIAQSPSEFLRDPHSILRLIERLARSEHVTEDTVCSVEWRLLPVLISFNRTPVGLHRRLERESEFFSEICQQAYRPDNAEQVPLSEDEVNKARNAFKLIESWRGLPGKADDGSVDEAKLRSWIDAVRKSLQQAGRSKIGDHLLGRVLGRWQGAVSGATPPDGLCAVLEDIANPEIEAAISMEIIYSRGVYSPNGGRSEREIAKAFRDTAKALEPRWPRAAGVLYGIAESYEGWARREAAEEALQHSAETDHATREVMTSNNPTAPT